MPVSGLHTWVDGEPITAALLNQNENAVAAKFNAGIVAADINASAAIGLGQLAARYQSTRVTIVATPAGMPAAAGIFGVVPFHDDGKGTWTCTRVTWATTDFGAKTGTFDVRFVTLALGVVSNPIVVASACAIANNVGDSGPISVAMSFAAARTCIVLESATQDATAVSSTEPLTVTLTLQRDIFA